MMSRGLRIGDGNALVRRRRAITRTFSSIALAGVIAPAGSVIGFAGCGGPSTLRARMDHAEHQGRAAENLLDEADQEIRALEVARGRKLLDEAKERLADPEIRKYPEHALLKDRMKDLETRFIAAEKEVARRALERAVLAHRKKLEEALARLEKAMEPVIRPEVVSREIDEARDAGDALKEQLHDGAELESKDKALAAYAATLRKSLDKAAAEGRHAEKAVSFRERPVAAHLEGSKLTEESKTQKDPAKKRDLTVSARDRFRSCATVAREMISAAPELAKLKIIVDGKATSPGAVAAACEKQADALDKQIAAADKRRPKASTKTAGKPKPPKAKKRT